jgi:hypothetical protein
MKYLVLVVALLMASCGPIHLRHGVEDCPPHEACEGGQEYNWVTCQCEDW